MISELTNVAHFAPTIADRGWRAWWQDTDMALADYAAGIRRMADGCDLPTAFVAHDDARYLGSVLLIESDLDERPQYRPWIAALWVEPDARGQGMAGRLIDAALAKAGSLGFARCYLCAGPQKTAFYEARGFQLLETDVAGLNIFVARCGA